MLAPSPEAFLDSGSIVDFKLAPEQRMPYEMTNKGLRFASASNTYANGDVDASTAVPMGYENHAVELEGFSGGNASIINEHPEAMRMCEDGLITIKLKRFGPTWQRIQCNALGRGQKSARRRLRKNGSYFGQSVQRIYIVDQPGR